MRVLLRQTQTKLFYNDRHQWTADARSAVDFCDVQRAIKIGRDAQLKGVEVVLAFDDPSCDLVLPLQAE